MSKKNETLVRILSSIVTLPIYLFLLTTNYFYNIPLLLVTSIVTIFCLVEFYKIATTDLIKPFIGFGIAGGVLINIIMYVYGYGRVYGLSKYFGQFDAHIIMGFIAILVALVGAYQVFHRPLKGGIASMAVTVFGLLLIVFPFSHMILIKSLDAGIFYLYMLHAAVMMNDSFAYFGGKLFGKHKVGLEASPNKSWEGYLFGMLFCIITVILANSIISNFTGRELLSWIESIVIGIVFSVIGFTGDLVESAVKRDGAIKDSGTIIPGHGGMWDVFDAMIFSMPLFYYYLKFRSIL